jgi:WD40 repeat protein
MKYLAPFLLAACLASTAQAEPITQFEISRFDNYLFSFSPDGALFTSMVDIDRVPELEIRNSETGELITRSTQSVSGGFSPAWMPDKRSFYTEGGGQGQLLYWNGSAWNLLDLEGFIFGMYVGGHASLSVDETMLSIDSPDGEITIVNLADLSWQHLETKEDASHLATWSPDGRYLATGHNATVIIWDAKDFHEVRRYEGLAPVSEYEVYMSVETLEWSPSGQYLAIGTFDGNGYLVEPSNAKAEPVDLLKGYKFVSQMQWVSKSKLFWQDHEMLTYMAAKDINSSDHLIFYDHEDDEIIYDHTIGPRAPIMEVNFLVQPLNGSGSVIVYSEVPDFIHETSVSYITIVDSDGDSTRKKLPNRISGMAVSPDGRFIAIREYVGNGVQKASLWDFDTFMDEL